MRLGLAALACLAASACGGRSGEPGVADDSAPVGPGASPASVPAEGVSASGGPCAGGFLPVTGLCADPRPGLFRTVDDRRDLFDPACVWRTEEVSAAPDLAILFRSQDCSAKGWDRDVYRWEDGSIWAKPASLVVDPGVRSLTVFDLSPGQSAEQAALATLSLAPAEERERCELREETGVRLAGRAFALWPTEELLAELNARHQNDVFDACGPYGLTNAAQVWEARETRALFHGLGQDDPMWDAKSYTFYRRGGDGVWRRDGAG
jgi:hypothetical protein